MTRSLYADLSDFPAVDHADWREHVTAELGGAFERLVARLPEGIDLEPLYDTPGESLPRPSRDAVGWRVAAELPARASLVDAAAGQGAELLWLKEPLAAQAELGSFLAGAPLGRLEVVIEGRDVSSAKALAAAAREREVNPLNLAGGVACDPFGSVLVGSSAPLEEALGSMAEMAVWTATELPASTSVLASAVPYHEAGSGAVGELAFGLATGVAYLRRLTTAGLDLDTACAQLRFTYGVSSDLFLEIAKLRAARTLWAKAIAACGGSLSAGQPRIHARSGAIGRTVAEPRLNLLRATAEGFAAALGGADSLALEPHQTSSGWEGVRLALNVQHMLAREGHLGRVADPAAGSGYLEALTDKLARAAWELFRQIEGDGGMEHWVTEGLAAGWARQAAATRAKQVAARKPPIVGASLFVDLEKELPQLEGEFSAAVPTLTALRWADLFESLRRVSGEWSQAHGRRPRAFLAQHGALADFGPRADFARRLLAAGGIESIDPPPSESTEALAAAFVSSEADWAVICGSPENNALHAAALTKALSEAGARRVLLAGRPETDNDALLDAGVSAFLYAGCDVVAVLRELLADLGATEDGSRDGASPVLAGELS